MAGPMPLQVIDGQRDELLQDRSLLPLDFGLSQGPSAEKRTAMVECVSMIRLCGVVASGNAAAVDKREGWVWAGTAGG